MKKYLFCCRQIIGGQSVLRSFLNFRLSKETLQGNVIDIGGGGNSRYISFMQRSDNVVFQTFDLKVGNKVDFESDPLPAADNTYDTVLFLNVMEHIYNYGHISNEVIRITKKKGSLVGFVPFLMWYHPDHSDFFRYTHEALDKILRKAGGKDIDIEVIGGGPFIAAAHMVLLSIPFRWLRVIIFTIFYVLDGLYQKIKGNSSRPYALGYYFKVLK